MITTINWEADLDSLSLTYKALVESKLDYGTILYNSVTVLKELNTTHKMVFVPTESVMFSVSETFLYQIRKRCLSIKFAVKIAFCPHNSVFQINSNLLQSKKGILPFYCKICNYLNELIIEA